MKELLNNFPVIYKHLVTWGEMDSFQHVNNTIYFRYLENARVLYGEKFGSANRIPTEGIGPILGWTECRFIKPVTYPDTLHIGIKTLSIQGSELLLGYHAVSTKLNKLAAAGRSITVLYDYRKRKRVDFPQETIARIETLEGKPVPRKHTSPPEEVFF